MIRLGVGFLIGSAVLLFINAILLGPTYVPGFPKVADRTLEMLYMVLPGLVGGFVARSKGALVGALVGLTGTAVTLVDAYLFYGHMRGIGLTQTLLVEIVPQTIAGLAGVHLPKRRNAP